MPPKIIAGRYRVERAVGRGGMGTVWLCRDEVLGREVAVKQVGVLPGESVPDLARALREARSSAALNHPHVVSVFDAVEADDHIWLVMEYVPGSTLSELIAREGRLAPRRVAVIGAQVADGLAAAHARGTVHRDVKPGNILVTDSDVAKIGDFGIARTEGEEQLTRSGLLTGTPLYFSPELARGAEPSPAADVWALGATLYAAVEGRPPIADRGNPIATLTAIAQAAPPRPEHAEFLTDAIGRMLDPDPRSRWSMADAAYALRRLRDQHQYTGDTGARGAAAAPPQPAPEPDTPVVRDPRRRRSRASLVLATVVALLLIGIGAAAVLDRRADEPAASSATGRRSASGEPSVNGPENRPRTSSESTPGPTPESTPEPTPESTPEPTPEVTPEPTPEVTDTAPAVASAAAQAVVDYYGLLPQDTATAWRMIGSDLQQDIGYDTYTGFWSTIDSVTVDDTSTVDAGVVLVDLTYTRSDGSAASETRELRLTPAGGGWLITGDRRV